MKPYRPTPDPEPVSPPTSRWALFVARYDAALNIAVGAGVIASMLSVLALIGYGVGIFAPHILTLHGILGFIQAMIVGFSVVAPLLILGAYGLDACESIGSSIRSEDKCPPTSRKAERNRYAPEVFDLYHDRPKDK